MKRVVIVGAGPCGLVALKEMLEAGHDAILFERSCVLGGVFASATVYSDLHLTISNWAMVFSDFPDPSRLCYPTAEHYLQYLHDYARHFGLEDRITYNADVVSAVVKEEEYWTLEVNLQNEQRILQIEADALIVATGANQIPKPTPKGLEGFRGRILHSTEYNDAFKREVAEKKLRVLVVGGGESAADVSAELGELSSYVSVWLRRQVCVGPRYLNSLSEIEQIKANKSRDFPANGFLEAATTNRMSAGQNVYIYGFFRRLLWRAPVLNSTLARMCLDSTAPALLKNDQATYVTKNERMCEAIHEEKIQALVCPDIAATGSTCEFQMPDGTVKHREFDAIVLCHGFRTQFPWLKVPQFDTSPRSWFLHCFPENLGHCLAFVGYARPHQGGIPVMAEMLSRYIALLLNGERRLPVDYTAQARRDRAAEREQYFLSPDLDSLVDYSAFLESVARRVGCEPRIPFLITAGFNFHLLAVLMLGLECVQPSLNPLGLQLALVLWAATAASFLLVDDGILIKWWFYPQWAVWYRQQGPGANSRLLHDTMRRVPLWKSTSITTGFTLLVLWSVPTMYLQRLVSAVVFVPHVFCTVAGIRFGEAWGGFLRPKLFALHGTPWRFLDLLLP